MAIPAALLLAPSLMQSATGMYQAAKGMSMKPERPDYEIPQEVLDNLTDAEINALQGLPDATVQQFVENAQRASQTAMAQMSGRKAGTSAIGDLYQKELDSYKDLLSQDALARVQNQSALTAARKDVASEKARAFDLNKYQPFLADAQAKRDLTGAGLKNVFGGLQTAMKIKMQQDLLAGLQDEGKAVPPPADSGMIDMSVSGLFEPEEMGGQIDYLNEDGEVSIDEYDEEINETDFDVQDLFGTANVEGITAAKEVINKHRAGSISSRKAQRLLNRIRRQYGFSKEVIAKMLYN